MIEVDLDQEYEDLVVELEGPDLGKDLDALGDQGQERRNVLDLGKEDIQEPGI